MPPRSRWYTLVTRGAVVADTWVGFGIGTIRSRHPGNDVVLANSVLSPLAGYVVREFKSVIGAREGIGGHCYAEKGAQQLFLRRYPL